MSKQAPLTWLRSFEASARHASFTRASLELNITQAAVSKQIKALESQLGCQLFKRHAHGLSLTEQGRRYWLDTHELINKLDNVTHQFLMRQQTNKVHVRCNISYSALVLCPRLREFRELHPDLAVEITHDVWEPEKPSKNSHIEIGYREVGRQLEQANISLLATDKVFPVVASFLDDNAIEKLPLIHVSGYYHEWRWWQEQFSSSMLDPTLDAILTNHSSARNKQDWVVDNSLVAYQLASQGLGIAMGRSSLVEGMIKSKQLRRFAGATSVVAPEGFYLSISELGEQQPAAKILFDFLTTEAA
jgi:LysR family glycine cleavage system transcriptional activator